jgi:hypothetical protein
MRDLITPSGENGSVVGFGAPLNAGVGKDALARPLERGAYVIATKDRKTVLKMLVLSKEEANFDSDAYATSELARKSSDELVARIRATWTIGQLTFESHDPMVYPSLDFLLDFSSRFTQLSEGAVADAISRRCLLPEAVRQPLRLDPRVDVREHVTINVTERSDGFYAYSLGLQKFVLPELEMAGLFEADFESATRFLLSLAQDCLMGDLVKSGDRFGAPRQTFEAREGGFDRSLWEGVPVLELLPPTAATAHDALASWEIELARLGRA